MAARRSIFALAALLGTACTDQQGGTAPSAVSPDFSAVPNAAAPAPSGATTVGFGPHALTLWPYFGEDVANGTAGDPVNLVFLGEADPRAIRAALMALDGNRTAFGMPAGQPFDCRWTDTPSGGVQAGWTETGGWVGAAIQLACGDFGPIRFHVRLARSGGWTIGNAHFEAQIPGTTEHQVLSWELAEQLVMVDMVRSGVLHPTAPLSPSGIISPAPGYRTIPSLIFNALPPELQAVAAGVPGNSATDVPIASDGRATIFNVAVATPVRAERVRRTFTITYGQVIPQPFCGGPADYLYVQGPITFAEDVSVDQDGRYTSTFKAAGMVNVTPVNPMTGQPAGPSFQAKIRESHSSLLSDADQRVESRKHQEMQPMNVSGRGVLIQWLAVDTQGPTAYSGHTLNCTP